MNCLNLAGDFRIWGEHLVTVNLLSDTVLSFVPPADHPAGTAFEVWGSLLTCHCFVLRLLSFLSIISVLQGLCLLAPLQPGRGARRCQVRQASAMAFSFIYSFLPFWSSPLSLSKGTSGCMQCAEKILAVGVLP